LQIKNSKALLSKIKTNKMYIVGKKESSKITKIKDSQITVSKSLNRITKIKN
jgi:hypothetical protein